MNVHRHTVSGNRVQYGILTALLLFLSCTQQNPMDPTSSLGGKFSLLADMSAAPAIIQTGGQKSQIQVSLKDEDGKAIRGATITFQTTLGSLTRVGAVTDANGWARDTLQSGTAAGWARVTASYQQTATVDSVQFSASADTTSFALQLSSDSDELYANGSSAAKLTVQLVSRGALSSMGKTVTLSTTAGSIPLSVIMGKSGSAEVILTSEAKNQDLTATVMATYEDQVVVRNVRMKGVEFYAEAAPSVIFADGTSASTVRAFLRETTTRIGISNETVRFGTTLGTVQAQMQTNEFGVSEAQLISGPTPGTAMVIARYGRTLLDTVRVEFRQASYSVNVNASATSILANGIDFATIQAVVKDASGRPLPNQSVYFATTAGDIDYVGTTDVAGSAKAKLISAAGSTDRTATVTVTVNEISKTLTVLFRGVQFSLTADPSFLIANGSSQSSITAMIRETTNKTGVYLAQVQFGTNLGTVPGSAESDIQGIARVLLTGSTTQGTAEIVGRYGNLFMDTVLVQFGSSVPAGIQQISANPGYILANGVDQAFISVKVVDSGNSPVVGAPVNFSATAGNIQTQDVTDANGVAMVPLVSSESTTDVVTTVTARFGNQSVSTNVVFEGVQMTVNASPLAILADGRSTSTISAILKRSTSKIAIANATLRLAADLGTIPAEVTSNAEGVAQAILTSSTTVGTAHVNILYGTSIRGSAAVNFQESIPTYLDVSVTPPVLPADGQSQSTLKATVSDANRNPVPNGTLVLFELISGSGTLERQKTTSSGVASTLLTSGTTPGSVTVRISVGSLSKDVQVVYTVGEPFQILVTSDRESMPADGIQVATVQARVLDAQGNPVSGITVTFSASIGDVTPTAPTNAQGIATAHFSSGIIGNSSITATVQRSSGKPLSGTKDIQLLPGTSNSMGLRFEPNWIGVKDTGQNQTLTIFSDIRDGKNQPVIDGTLVRFGFIGSSLGSQFNTLQSIPTVGGTAQISLTSGTVCGSIRVRADVVNSQGQPVNPPVNATSTQVLVHAGPPYIENVNDLKTTHMTVAAARLNIWSLLDTTQISIMVGDKYNNPVEKGTAVYLTTSGGVVSTHTAYTNEYGKASVILTGGNPQPTIDRFYNYIGLQDPNTKQILPGFVYYGASGLTRLPNFDAYPESAGPGEAYPGISIGRIINSEGNTGENDGIARIIAYTEGMDATGASARPWDWTAVALSGQMHTVEHNGATVAARFGGMLYEGESATIRITVMDDNGNPIASGTDLKASLTNSSAQAKLSWAFINTGAGMGTSYYYITISNAIDPEKPKSLSTGIRVEFSNANQNGFLETGSIFFVRVGSRP